MSPLFRRGTVPEEPVAPPANHWSRVGQAWSRIQSAGGVLRPNYTWCLLHVAGVAHHLGYERFSAVELGCAGGNGLLALEAAAGPVEDEYGVAIEIHGFDAGSGLPPAEDPRDAPFIMEPGHFPMDESALRARLKRTELHIGPVARTVPGFPGPGSAPLGFVVHDLDYYSSTRDALAMLLAPAEQMMPRVLAYYDDTLGYPWADGLGERAANLEFNAEHGERRRVDRLEGMRFLLPPSESSARWAEALHLIHVLDHPRYAEYEGTAISTRLDLAR